MIRGGDGGQSRIRLAVTPKPTLINLEVSTNDLQEMKGKNIHPKPHFTIYIPVYPDV